MSSQIVHGFVLEWHRFGLKVLISSNFQAFEESFQNAPTNHTQTCGSKLRVQDGVAGNPGALAEFPVLKVTAWVKLEDLQ